LQSFLSSNGNNKTEEPTNVYYISKISMGIILWIIFGALVGWVASLIMSTDGEQGALLNIIVGIIGAVVGGWIMSFVGETGVTGFNLYSFMVAIIGAVVLITIIKFFQRA